MNVLAIDTCLGAVSVAARWRAGRGEMQLREAYEERSAGHAERLMPMTAEVMAAAGLTFGDLGRIAVTVGPGSFTGARAGVAAARGLALAAGLPVVGAISLAVMAHRAEAMLGAARAGRALAVAVDARRDMVYFQLFPLEPDTPSAVALLTPREAAHQIGSRPTILVGSGASAVATALEAQGQQAEIAFPDLQPHAAALALMAPGLTPAKPLAPLYLRAPDARPQDDKSLPRAAP
jgi:tRNA threonylcarbamoyladenosine biosynthesis protein TsaB